MRKIIILLYITAKLLLSTAFAQTSYPLYVVPTLTPPYSLNLSDYSKFGSQNLMITINANDLNISNLPVKLHVKIETVGITIETPPTINTTPVFINGGETNVLFGEDLEDYFNINNLIFKGFSKNTYRRTGQLPEGFYKFSIDVLHYNSNRPISNIGTVTAWIALGKPPVLKQPLNNAKMGQYKGVPLTFSWLPAAVGSPVSANSIQYKFEMWEMYIPAINPNTIAATTPLFHEHTDFNTIYTLYPSTLLMTPGMQYAWRITASDVTGFVPFEQKGHSEIRTFIYKAACDSVTDLSAQNRGRNALFKWIAKSNHTAFNIEMQNPETGWISNSESFESKAQFFDLNYGDTYKMRVQAVCDGDPDSKSDFSDWKTITIPKPAPPTDDCPECVCDDKIPDAQITNFDLKDDLQPGDTIINKTGTSRYIVKSVEPQGDGAYKGVFLFWTEIWNLKFICNYWDLQVNTDNVIVNMDFESVYDPKFLVDIDAATGYLDSLSNNISTLITDLTPKDTVNTDDSIISIYVNDGDSLIVVTVDDDGNTNEIVLSDDADDAGGTLITDDDGNEYIINNDGKPMGTGEYLNTGGGNQDKIDNYNKDKEENHLSESVTINFTEADKQKYGFDSYNDQKSALQTKYPTLKNGYRAAFKSIASFGSDIVGVSSKHSNVVYKDEMGIPCAKTGENLNIRGSTNGSDVTLYAYHTVNDTTEKVAGKLNILSFDEQAKQLYIVPVNGANVPDAKALKDVINSTYKQAITRWEVTKIDNLADVTFKDGKMSHGGTSAISVYNKDQRTIVKRFKEVHGKLEKDAYYLFFVEGVQFKGRSIAGYMPLQRQVGFIYDNPNLNIIAHELGHGAFNLRHTFSSDNFIASEMSTQNLMDYKGGIELWKHQWKLIQSPDKLLFSWAQDEQEGEMISTNDTTKFNIKITSINSDFAPGLGVLNISYSLDNSTKKLVEKYKHENFITKMFVFDKDGNKLFEKKGSTDGKLSWDGYYKNSKNNKDSIKYKNGPFKLSLALTNVDSTISKWQDFKDMVYEKVISDSINTFAVGCDTTFNILTGAHLDWVENKDIQYYVYPNNLKTFKKYYDIYMSYEGVNKAGSPFEYIKNNTKRIEFLGRKVLVHNEFAKILEKVKSKLTSKGVYDELSTKYKRKMGTLVMRTINDPKGGGKISEHGLGMAIDFYPKKNPQIHKNNASVRLLIKQSTGFDIGKKGKSVNDIKNAHNTFMSIFGNTNIDSLSAKYERIDKYYNNESNINLDSLHKINRNINNISITYRSIKNSGTTTRIDSLVTEINKYSKIISELKMFIPICENTLIFDSATKSKLDDLDKSINKISDWLTKVSDNISDTTSIVINDKPEIIISEYNVINDKIKTFNKEMKKNYKSYTIFSKTLNKRVKNIGFNNILLQDGFCDLELELINAFLEADSRIQWGGIFNSKVDAMHFGFTSKSAKEIVNGK